MNERSGRRVHITFANNQTKIVLAWWDNKAVEGRGFEMITMTYVNGMVTESVDKALDILVAEWSRVFVGNHDKSIVSCELDRDPELFDAITQAEEPEQYFVSRHTLEYKGGQSAAMRLWEVNFQEQYKGLIAFNQRASAKA